MVLANSSGSGTEQQDSPDPAHQRQLAARQIPRVTLAAGSRHGANRFNAPQLHRPDRPNPFGAIAAWNGQIVEAYGRNSHPTLCGDARSFVQLDDFPRELLSAGYAVRVNDEQGKSAKQIEAADRRHNRVVLQGIIARLIARESHYLAVLELSRLARDESGQDPAYLKKVIREHCNGTLITRPQILHLRDCDDARRDDYE